MTVNQITRCKICSIFINWMAKSVDPDQMSSSEGIRSASTPFARQNKPRWSKTRVKMLSAGFKIFSTCHVSCYWIVTRPRKSEAIADVLRFDNRFFNDYIFLLNWYLVRLYTIHRLCLTALRELSPEMASALGYVVIPCKFLPLK